MQNLVQVSIVDNDKSCMQLLVEILKKVNTNVKLLAEVTQFADLSNQFDPEVIFLNGSQIKMEPGQFFNQLLEKYPQIFLFVTAGYENIKGALSGIRKKNIVFLSKPLQKETVEDSILRCVKQIEQRKNTESKGGADRSFDLLGLIGNSKEIQEVLEVVKKVVHSDSTILIMGESGTGKELIAKIIHANSSRKNKPFVAINCGALPETLLESELFGHEKGAFTGAIFKREGLVEAANDGTLFLDEIGETSSAMQVKLLRFVQEGTFKRVGDNRESMVNARIISATNKNLYEAVEKGEFREDLYYRLNVVNIEIPPLRDRMDDLPLLIISFLKKHSEKMNKVVKGFVPEVVEKLFRYAWLGNIRELENVVECAVAMVDGEMIEMDDLPANFQEKISHFPRKTRITDVPYKLAREEFERRYFEALVKRCDNNLSIAAKMSGISRKSIRTRLYRFGIKYKNKDGLEEE